MPRGAKAEDLEASTTKPNFYIEHTHKLWIETFYYLHYFSFV